VDNIGSQCPSYLLFGFEKILLGDANTEGRWQKAAEPRPLCFDEAKPGN
jgi:hypothetical protein